MAYGNLATMTMENKCQDKQDKARRLKAQKSWQGLVAHVYHKHNTIQYEVKRKHCAKTIQFCMQQGTTFMCSRRQGCTEGGGLGGFKPPSPKFRSFDKAEPNSQFRGKYIPNNLIRIRASLICKLSGTPD
jgi:hypothetical protein